jgi:predicted nuclease of predicted toxin-antitoxin system
VLRLLIDHDFNERILKGLQKRVPELDAVTARMIGFEEKPDTELLARAAVEDLILLTHDVQTMPSFAISRVRNGEPMPGLLVVPQQFSIGRAIEELTTIVLCSDQSEWRDLIIHLPL